MLTCVLEATPTTSKSKTKTKEETIERIDRKADDAEFLVRLTVDRLKKGERFKDPISTINIEAIRKLTNNKDGVEQRVDAIEKTVEMGTGCQTAISKRLIKGLILTKTFGKMKTSELCKKTGLNREDIRKATELVKIWRTARNLLNYNLGNIPASTLYKLSRHFLQVVGGLIQLIVNCSILPLPLRRPLRRQTTVLLMLYLACFSVASAHAQDRQSRSRLG
jgi:hypothetical protein